MASLEYDIIGYFREARLDYSYSYLFFDRLNIREMLTKFYSGLLMVLTLTY